MRRYSYGGDEHIFVEVGEEMSLDAFFKSLCRSPMRCATAEITGVTEICPANASFQIKFDPDRITPDDLLTELKRLGGRTGEAPSRRLKTRIVEIPVLLQRSLDARDADALPRAPPGPERHRPRLRRAHQRLSTASRPSSRPIPARPGSSRWSASSPACPSSTRWSSAQKQIEAPKYLRPRTDTPKLTVGHGGCFGCIYSVRGAGGYQMFGITPMPIYDPNQEISYLRDFMMPVQAGRHREVQADRPRRL